MDIIKISAPAKINLFLEIVGIRPDGYANIRSLVQAISLYDEITVEKAHAGLALSCDDPRLPLDESNTVAKAWAVFCSAIGKEIGARIHISKRIPWESGLGGGSSDAAATLVALSKINGFSLDRKTFETLGSAVGSDVPFFFGSGTSLVEGRGEIVSDVAISRDYALLVVMPDYGMSTNAAYAFAKKGLTKGVEEVKIDILGSAKDPIDFCALGNALESAFFDTHPNAAGLKKRLIEAGARYAATTGSGSALFGIFDELSVAEKASESFEDIWNTVVKPVSAGLL